MKRTSFLALAALALTAAACDRSRASQTTTTSGTTTTSDGTSTRTTGAATNTGTTAMGASDTAGAITPPKSDPTASDFGRDAGGLGSGSRIETGTQNIGVGHGGGLDDNGARNPHR